jgi:hypothetical protein
LNRFNGNFVEAEMVKASISSIEYRQRCGKNIPSRNMITTTCDARRA